MYKGSGRDAGKPARGTQHRVAPQTHGCGTSGSSLDPENHSSFGLAVLEALLHRDFHLNLFFLVKLGFSPTPLQSEIRCLMDQQAEKITEEKF